AADPVKRQDRHIISCVGPISLPQTMAAKEHVQLVINYWINFNQPGRYSLYLISNRVLRRDDPAKSAPDAHPGGTPVEVLSNRFDLTILPKEPKVDRLAFAAYSEKLKYDSVRA